MTLALRPFQVDDLYGICNRDGEQVPDESFREGLMNGPALTVLFNGEPIGAGGIVIVWPGVGHGWMRLSSAMAPYMRWCFRVTRQFLIDVRNVYKLHRIETEALKGFEQNQRWAEHLGFTREVNGEARSILPDKRTMVRYEMVTHG